MSRVRWIVAGLALALTTCGQAIMTAPPGSTVTLTANPSWIPAFDGASVITAFILDPTGMPVADGTVVQFFTTLGTIDEQGKTNDGVARVFLRSNGRSGEAVVTGYSGGAVASGSPNTTNTVALSTTTSAAEGSNSIPVTIGGVPKTVRVNVNPARLVSPIREAEVSATVYDDLGNPLPGVSIMFAVTEGESESDPAKFESLGSGGVPVYTDNNGRAYDRLTTRYSPTGAVRYVTVTASSATDVVSDTFVVQIN